MIASGIIAGSTVRLKEMEPTDWIRGVMMIELEGRNVKSVVAALLKNPGFSGLNTMSCLWDLEAEIEIADNRV